MLKEGTYKVISWNGKDGYMVDENDEMIVLSKSELPDNFNGRLVPGERIQFKMTPTLVNRQGTEDEREREAQKTPPVMSPRVNELMHREAERRSRYGAGPGMAGR